MKPTRWPWTQDNEKRFERAERMTERKVAAKRRKSDVEKARKAVRKLQERAKASARWDGEWEQ